MTEQISSTSDPEPAPQAPGAPDAAAVEAGAGEPKKDKKKKSDANRGIETMFRVTYMNHIALSQLADNKANMLISVNGFIISVGIAVLTPRLGSLSWVYAPALVLIAGCMISLAFAVIGSRPRLNRTEVTVEQIRNNEASALFFGQFLSMPLSDFQESIHTLMDDPRLLYDNLIRQLYSMGQNLHRKFQFVQIAYTVFLANTALATVMFAVTLLAVGFER